MGRFQGDYLKQLRNSKGYSQEMVARLLALKTGRKVTRGAVCNWEKGRSVPTTGSLLGLSVIFHVPPESFFGPASN